MKTLVTAVVALSLVNGAVMAQPFGRGPDYNPGRGPGYDQGRGNDNRPGNVRWSRGDRLPSQYLESHYRITNYRQLGLREPARNQRWVRDDNNNFYLIGLMTGVIAEVIYNQSQTSGRWARGDRLPYQYLQNPWAITDYRKLGLAEPRRGERWVHDNDDNYYLVAIATGIIINVLYRNEREQRWNQRHARTYTYNDDIYYRECRSSSDPAGVIIGAIIGGLLGNQVAKDSNNRSAATAAGIILGGALGAAMTKDLDCNDRSYAYKTYYNGLNSGRPGARYSWRNPSNNHRGDFVVGRYYNDPDNFRCADFTQTIYIDGRPREARGVACRQPDGTWAIVN